MKKMTGVTKHKINTSANAGVNDVGFQKTGNHPNEKGSAFGHQGEKMPKKIKRKNKTVHNSAQFS